MEKGSFGERLKREREMRRVSLAEVSAATRISVRFLDALESERWELLPGGIFNRGFVRAVARFLGLDEEALVAEYVAATNDLPAVAVTAKTPGRSRRRAWRWVALGAVVVLALAGWIAYRRRSAALYRPVQGAAQTKPAPAGPGSTVASPVGAASTPATVPMKLRIEVGRATRLRVAADGKAVFDGEMKSGESRDFAAQEEFQVSASDSSAVLLKLNGYTLPPLGPPEAPGSATITRAELKKLEPGPL